jgi:hypothetical protein
MQTIFMISTYDVNFCIPRLISVLCAQGSRQEGLKVQEKQGYRFTRTPKHYASWGFRRSLTNDYRQRLENIALRFLRILSRAMRGMSPWRWR